MYKLDEIHKKAEYCLNCKTKPCTKGCPLGNRIPDFIQCIKKGEYKKAYEILNETTVLQPICGRICPHEKQCQGNCVRGIKGKPVEIGELEAFIGDMAIEENWKIGSNVGFSDVNKQNLRFSDSSNSVVNDKGNIDKAKKVAVVGGGPAGLTCAAFLAIKGYDVTIYEKHDKLGGLLRYGIPDFRLDREILDKQIKRILDLGINVICGKELGKDFGLSDLRDCYDDVFLCFGANVSKRMNISGENLNGVFGGNELLESGFHPNYNGKKVAVIGGGNVAMDVSRTIKRLGAECVYVIYRRAEEQMPAEKKEIFDAKNEEVEFLFQSNVTKINGDSDGFVTSVECVKTELRFKDGDSRLVPVDIEGSNFVVPVDYVIMAIGSGVDEDTALKLGVKLDRWGFIEVDENFMTSVPDVFSGGDLAGFNATVAWAARSGRDVASIM